MLKNRVNICLCIIALMFSTPFLFLSDIETVEVTCLKETEYSPVVEVNGIIEKEKIIPISLSYPVYIKEQYVYENDYVNKGQLLFTLDIEKMENAVKLNNLTDQIEAYSSNDKSIFMTISDKIYASENGYVTQIAATEGNIVLSDEIMCVINTKDDLILKITINQDDYDRISVGDIVEFSPQIKSSKIYYGQICNKTAKIRKQNSITGSKTVMDIYATINSNTDDLINGIEFSGKVYKSNKGTIFMLPYEYINQDDNGEYLKIYNNNNIEKIYIETGIESKEYVEIITQFEKDTLFLKNDYNGNKKILIKYDYR